MVFGFREARGLACMGQLLSHLVYIVSYGTGQEHRGSTWNMNSTVRLEICRHFFPSVTVIYSQCRFN